MSLRSYSTKLSVYLDELLVSNAEVVNIQLIQKFLAQKSLTVNKTSLYRQLHKMEQNSQIQSIQTSLGQMWEKLNQVNHGHMACNRCEKVFCVLINPELMNIKKLNSVNKFEITGVNFAGRCSKCINV